MAQKYFPVLDFVTVTDFSCHQCRGLRWTAAGIRPSFGISMPLFKRRIEGPVRYRRQ
jgi:hypothetical protein